MTLLQSICGCTFQIKDEVCEYFDNMIYSYFIYGCFSVMAHLLSHTYSSVLM